MSDEFQQDDQQNEDEQQHDEQQENDSQTVVAPDAMITDTVLDLPVIVLRNMIVYPDVATSIIIGRRKSLIAIERSQKFHNSEVLLLAQRDEATNDPSTHDIYSFGVLARIIKKSKHENGLKIMVESISRARVTRLNITKDILRADLECVMSLPSRKHEDVRFIDILLEKCALVMQQAHAMSDSDIEELMNIVRAHTTLDSVMNHVAFVMYFRLAHKQELLELIDVDSRFIRLMEMLSMEAEFNALRHKIDEQTKQQLEKNQRDYYLNEKIKAIRKEIHDGTDPHQVELDELEQKAQTLKAPKHAKEQMKSEIKKLRHMPPMSSESTVVRNYVELLIGLPWHKKTRVNYNLTHAQDELEKNHCGLREVKDSILEFLAVSKRTKGNKGHASVLCLVGPPGVGKTSIAESIATACNRKFERIALGGLHDESEIRGHRRTYIGAMPGKIIQKVQHSGVSNPLILLDEIDKIGKDYRGDPASALLEVLDPEQNKRFVDNYLEVEYDLSQVLFVCTANTANLPEALLDRMEIVHLSGYTEQDKLTIAENFLFPKQKERTGVAPGEIQIQRTTMKQLIRHYTRESGVRELERKLNQICRKVVRAIEQPERVQEDMQLVINDYIADNKVRVTNKKLVTLLGAHKYDSHATKREDKIGQIHGLAWTRIGGEILDIQVQLTPAKATKIIYTGSLGNVMKESVQAALTVARHHLVDLDKDIFDAFNQHEIHVHLPAGATPKDGPSAGIGLVCVLVSRALNVPIFGDLAVTGEVDISGNVLAIGGLQEKLGAAVRHGITQVIIPKENAKDLTKIPKDILDALTIHTVKHMSEVWRLALKQYNRLSNKILVPPIVENIKSTSGGVQVN